LLLGEVDHRLGIRLAGLAGCFSDGRNPNSVEHSVQALVAQRAYALALSDEDLNDHDLLRSDSVLVLLMGKRELAGEVGSENATKATRWPGRARSTGSS